MSNARDFVPPAHTVRPLYFQPTEADLNRFFTMPKFMFRDRLNIMIIDNVILVSNVHCYFCYLNILKKPDLYKKLFNVRLIILLFMPKWILKSTACS
jgi:hypothetical protein